MEIAKPSVSYIANIRIPTEKAHGFQVMNTCDALARAGAKVELVVPRGDNPIKDDPFSYYGLKPTFTVRMVEASDFFIFRWIKPLAFVAKSFSFARAVVADCKSGRIPKGSIIYGRGAWALAFVSFFSGRPVFWETHTGEYNFAAKMLVKRAAGIVCITKGLADFYAERGASRDRLHIAPDAIDVSKYDAVTDSKPELRAKCGLPADAKIAAYIGSIGVYSWKGVDVFLESAKFVKDPSIKYLVLGGSPEEAAALRQKYPDDRINAISRVHYDLIPQFSKAADALVLPNKAGDIISERFTSPMKLFEYMASGVPIVASDLPSIREILDENSAAFFKPNDAADLARAIESALSDGALAAKLGSRAHDLAGQYTWDKRAEGIMDFISAHER